MPNVYHYKLIVLCRIVPNVYYFKTDLASLNVS
jgi:hypothetical protein